MKKIVSIVVSMYNEEKNINKLFEEFEKIEQKLKGKVGMEYILVNDGSNDNTLELSKNIQKTKKFNIKILNLFRNFGHEIAMTAGMDHAEGDCVVFMDGDLQHPPLILLKMINYWVEDGIEIVLTKKKDQTINRTYKFLKDIYYWFFNKISDIFIPKDHPDFRLIDRKYINILKKINERERMFRGLLHYIGIKNYKVIEFDVPERYAGKSKYSMKDSLRLAINGILQFSTKPLRLAIYLGLSAALLSGVLALFTIIQYMFFNFERTGYATILITIIFIGSIQLIVLGIIGEYIAKIHIESKKRPLYFGEVIKDE